MDDSQGECSDPVDPELLRRWWLYRALLRGDRLQRLELEHGRPPDVLASVKFVDETIERGGAPAAALLCALAESAATEEELAYVAAGPLEDFFAMHPGSAADHVAAVAPGCPRLAAALWSVNDEAAQHLAAALE